ncbi:MAG TPA: condensation domain-containing protein, partial [Longimicrobium sp.]|nr:condensation domain-containing protein [Longimicrobium sp.]
MSDVADALAGLSPERRRLLELRLAARQAQAAGPALSPRQRPDGTAPLSASQARLWVMERLEPGRALYVVPLAFRVRGALDAEALRRALEVVIHRHEALRTTFAERAEGPVQVVHPPSPLPLPIVDLSNLSPEEREEEVRRRVDEDANTGFDLETGPVFRSSLLRLADDDHALLISMHHVASDGWSAGILCREASEAYAALVEGRDPALPQVPLQYADFAVWQHEHLRGETLDRLVAFWRRTLDGAPPALELPAARVRPEGASHAGRTLIRHLDASLAERLRAFARDADATFFHVLAAGFRAVLARHSGQDDVVIGTPTAGRQSRAVEGV